MKAILVALMMVFVLTVSCSKQDAESEDTVGGNSIANNQKGLGTSSYDLLSDDTFTSMVIEVVYVEGYEPSATAINNFVAFLNERVYKSQGISVVKRAIASPGKATFTNQEIIAIEDANRTKYNTSNQIAVWAFFADGASANSTTSGFVLGTAYRNTSFVIFEKNNSRIKRQSV